MHICIATAKPSSIAPVTTNFAITIWFKAPTITENKEHLLAWRRHELDSCLRYRIDHLRQGLLTAPKKTSPLQKETLAKKYPLQKNQKWQFKASPTKDPPRILTQKSVFFELRDPQPKKVHSVFYTVPCDALLTCKVCHKVPVRLVSHRHLSALLRRNCLPCTTPGHWRPVTLKTVGRVLEFSAFGGMRPAERLLHGRETSVWGEYPQNENARKKKQHKQKLFGPDTGPRVPCKWPFP